MTKKLNYSIIILLIGVISNVKFLYADKIVHRNKDNTIVLGSTVKVFDDAVKELFDKKKTEHRKKHIIKTLFNSIVKNSENYLNFLQKHIISEEHVVTKDNVSTIFLDQPLLPINILDYQLRIKTLIESFFRELPSFRSSKKEMDKLKTSQINSLTNILNSICKNIELFRGKWPNDDLRVHFNVLKSKLSNYYIANINDKIREILEALEGSLKFLDTQISLTKSLKFYIKRFIKNKDHEKNTISKSDINITKQTINEGEKLVIDRVYSEEEFKEYIIACIKDLYREEGINSYDFDCLLNKISESCIKNSYKAARSKYLPKGVFIRFVISKNKFIAEDKLKEEVYFSTFFAGYEHSGYRYSPY